MSTNQQNPSLVGGHVEYTKGAVETGIGSVTGSQSWTDSGEQAKAHAVETMKAAGAQRDPAKDGYGKVEQKLGEVAGCEGMVEEGAASKKQE